MKLFLLKGLLESWRPLLAAVSFLCCFLLSQVIAKIHYHHILVLLQDTSKLSMSAINLSMVSISHRKEVALGHVCNSLPISTGLKYIAPSKLITCHSVFINSLTIEIQLSRSLSSYKQELSLCILPTRLSHYLMN